MYLSQINTYPIKSTHPISVKGSFLSTTGVSLDRHWMLVDDQNAMLTSRKHPKLLHIFTQVEGRHLRVILPYGDYLLPLKPQPQSETVMVQHWGSEPLAAWPQNDALDVALSDYLGLPCRLVYSASLYAAEPDEAGVSFADAQPVLLTTTASLQALNERLDDPLSMQRFRTNLVVSNQIADVEDSWRKIRIGVCELEVTYPCERCVLTTIDPDSLEVHSKGEPLRTLAQYRRLEAGGVGFGINLKVIKGGPIAVDDRVEVLA